MGSVGPVGLALALAIALAGLVAASLWAIIDASLQPHRAYATAGLNKGWVTTLLILTCAIGALVYFAFLRPRLRRPSG